MKQVYAILLLLSCVPGHAGAATSELVTVPMEQDESYEIRCAYAPLYGQSGPTVSSATCTVERTDGSDATPSGIVDGAVSWAAQKVSVRITPTGRRGNTYRVHCLATMSNGDKSACNFRVQVKEPR